jgi:ferredoxin-NADP reductase/ferredoxin
VPGGSAPGPGAAGNPLSGVSVECDRDETVLSALTRQGIALPSACQAGVCRACLVRVLQGDPGPAGAAGLDDALRGDGYFLACQARPAADLTVALAGGDIYTPARLLSVRRDGTALRVRVRPEKPLSFRAGQHVAVRIPAAQTGMDPAATDRARSARSGTLKVAGLTSKVAGLTSAPQGADLAGGPQNARGAEVTAGRGEEAGHADLVRVYSFANRPAEADRDGVEFYVRVYPGGAMSEWLAGAGPGDELSLGRPSGRCCYWPGEPEVPLLLAGTGTGVAPLAAVARDALAHGHRGPIVLLRGAAQADGLGPEEYLPGPPVRARTCVLSEGEDIVAAAVAEYAALAAWAARTAPSAAAGSDGVAAPGAAGASGSLAGPGGPTGPGGGSPGGLAGPGGMADPAALVALAAPPGMGGTRVYLCGGAGVVARMRRALFLAGQPLRRIHCDEFSPAVNGGP